MSMFVGYYWYGSPKRDFTVKIYSKDDISVYDAVGNTNMLHTDGTAPSEFDLYVVPEEETEETQNEESTTQNEE